MQKRKDYLLAMQWKENKKNIKIIMAINSNKKNMNTTILPIFDKKLNYTYRETNNE